MKKGFIKAEDNAYQLQKLAEQRKMTTVSHILSIIKYCIEMLFIFLLKPVNNTSRPHFTSKSNKNDNKNKITN